MAEVLTSFDFSVNMHAYSALAGAVVNSGVSPKHESSMTTKTI